MKLDRKKLESLISNGELHFNFNTGGTVKQTPRDQEAIEKYIFEELLTKEAAAWLRASDINVFINILS